MSARVPAYLRHVSIRKTIPYEVATEIQNHLVKKQLDYKASISSQEPPPKSPPEPHILTFGTSPVYTFGRRQRISALSKSTIDSLIAPMPGIAGDKFRGNKPHRALLFETQRGGQTTYHGPGQILIWPIMNIKDRWPACGPLDVRGYVRLLEECTIMTLRQFGCRSTRTKHPGVWDLTGEKKIAALGVHLRRNISSYGVACNLNTDLRFYERIVACGLVDKGTTNVRELTGKRFEVPDFAEVWVANMARLLYGPSLNNVSSKSQPLSRIVSGTVRRTGVGPEVLRRLWYLDAPRELVQSAQQKKKIVIEDEDSSSTSSASPSLDNKKSEVTSAISSGEPNSSVTSEDGQKISETRTRIQDLLTILDEKEQKIIQPSFRKCAGISYWTPPLLHPCSASVIRKVGVN
ncbi:putative octanoyltransferase [Golovinomyces cichoracearum]|uniref:lipoyl(octanoyl) transferase n=1 Tax=Golovinomyces cichoracearum TaxID=62708 RepID=A0A420INF7_9PEZI|nr:putative octanoyltransferase [Golovinomyces cichoracearum]